MQCIVTSMDATPRPLESPPASPDSAILPTSSLTPGPAEIREDDRPANTVPCDSCDGDGFHDRDGDAQPCSLCAGRGYVHDVDTWPGLARASAEQAERFRVELSEARSQLTSMRTERDLLRRQVETAQHEVRLYAAKAQTKIDEMHREHRAEVEDLQRQLRVASRRIVALKSCAA